MKITRAYVAGILAALAACLGERGSGSDAGRGESWSVSPEPLVEIGELEGDAHYLFEAVTAVRLLPNGRVAVADRGYGTIRVYNADGELEAEMGRPGEGPGEFESLSSIVVHPPDTLVIHDSGQYRLTTFLVDGTFVEAHSLRPDDGRPEVSLGRFDNGDHAFAWIGPAERPPGVFVPDPMHFGRFGADGSLIARIGSADGMVRYYSDAGGGPIPFSPFLHAFVHRDSVYATDGLEEMTVLDGAGDRVRSFELPPVAVEVGAALSRLRAQLELREDEWALELLDEMPTQGAVPRVAEVLLDGAGHFWMKRYDPVEDSNFVRGFGRRSGGMWWVVDPSGEVVATIELPDELIAMDIRGDRVAGLTLDELDVERVAVYRIVR
jgi:hypothetical protein